MKHLPILLFAYGMFAPSCSDNPATAGGGAGTGASGPGDTSLAPDGGAATQNDATEPFGDNSDATSHTTLETVGTAEASGAAETSGASGTSGSVGTSGAASGAAATSTLGDTGVGGSTGAETTRGEKTGPSGFGNCVDQPAEDACLAGERCLVDDPDLIGWGFCSARSCVSANDCPSPPAGGNPVVACVAVAGGRETECSLGCGGGRACPDGMECIDDTTCAWPSGYVSDFDGTFCSEFGAGLDTCDPDFATELPFSGQLACDPTGIDFLWDIFLVELTAGDCVSVFADNIDAAVGATGNTAGDLLMVVHNEMTDDGITFDDDRPCTDPAFGGFSCPGGAFMVNTTGVHEIGVGQWGDADCPAPSPYSVYLTINGVPFDLTTAGLSASDHRIRCEL